MFYCYLICTNNITYIGITNDLNRRLLQHNGQLAGGAKSTRRYKTWEYHTVVAGFLDKNSAARFEYLWKQASGLEKRIRKLDELLSKPEWNELSVIKI